MLTNQKNQAGSDNRKVVSLHHYSRGVTDHNRHSPPTPEAAEANAVARQAQVFHHLRSLSSTFDRCGVAVAVAVLMRDGSMDLSAVGVEPEYAGLITSGLDRLSRALRAQRDASKAKRWRGSISLSLATCIGFIAATYLNNVAWLDALLMLLSQLSAVYLCRPRSHSGYATRSRPTSMKHDETLKNST